MNNRVGDQSITLNKSDQEVKRPLISNESDRMGKVIGGE